MGNARRLNYRCQLPKSVSSPTKTARTLMVNPPAGLVSAAAVERKNDLRPDSENRPYFPDG